jgi:hypothetical protein
MRAREPPQHPRTVLSQAESYHALITRVGSSFDESRAHRSVDESDDAVVPQQQVICDVAHRRRRTGMASDREEQLVLRRGDAGVDCLLLAPVQEATQPVSECEESAVVGFSERPRHISQYDISDAERNDEPARPARGPPQ